MCLNVLLVQPMLILGLHSCFQGYLVGLKYGNGTPRNMGVVVPRGWVQISVAEPLLCLRKGSLPDSISRECWRRPSGQHRKKNWAGWSRVWLSRGHTTDLGMSVFSGKTPHNWRLFQACFPPFSSCSICVKKQNKHFIVPASHFKLLKVGWQRAEAPWFCYSNDCKAALLLQPDSAQWNSCLFVREMKVQV